MSRARRVLVLAALALAGGTANAAPSPFPEKVGAPVHQALRTQEWVRVVVLVEGPAPGRRESLEAVRGAVRAAQDRVLALVPPAQLHLHRVLATAPVFSATVSRAGLEKLASLPGVVRVDLDQGGTGSLAEAVPLTNTDDVHALGFTGQGVTVAVIDSGIDTNHPDLADDLVAEACFCSGGGGCCPGGGATRLGPGAAEDDNGHGSNVSGIVTSRGTIAPVGTAPDAGIVAVKVLDAGNGFCCTSDVLAALDWVLDNRPDVDVVNMSLGTFALYGGTCDNASADNQAFAMVIGALRANGVLSFVSSLNNASLINMSSPACVADAVSVGAVYDSNVGGPYSYGVCSDATTAADKITCFTNRNATLNILAPGAPITSTSNTGGTSTYFGTSQASPHVAGCAANLLQELPGTSAAQLEAVLESTGVPIFDPATSLTFPRVDCLAAAIGLDPCHDADGDTYPISVACGAGPADCDDHDPAAHPGAAEVCDFTDNDCNGAIDEGVCPSSCRSPVVPWDNTTSTSLRAPSLRLRYGRSVYLIRASELTAAGLSAGMPLQGIAWAYSTAPGLVGTGSLKVYLQNTADTTNTKSTTWSTAITGMSEVYNASTELPNVTGPFNVTFPTSFTFTGAGLYVAFDWQYPVGTLSTTVAVQTEVTLVNGLLGGQSTTTPPTTLVASNSRPATWLLKGAPTLDVGVQHVRTLGAMPTGLIGAHVVQAVITNRGGVAATNVPVTLDITGSSPFSNTQNVASLAACSGQTTVSFAGYSPGPLGSNTVRVFAPPDGVPRNDQASVPMDVTVNRYSYKHPGTTASGGTGTQGSTSEFAAKFTTASATQVDAVHLAFDTTGASYRVTIRGDNGSGRPGTLLYQDAADRTVSAVSETIRLPSPVAVGPGNFFVGIVQVTTTTLRLSYDSEAPLRPLTFFLANPPGPTFVDLSLANTTKLNVGVNLGACLVPLSVDAVATGSSSVCAGAGLPLFCNVTGGTGTLSIQWTENGVDVPGATAASFTPVKAAPGSFTYNCHVTDDGGCLGVQDVSAVTGTWVGAGGACDDGNGCTAPDTCSGTLCTGPTIQSPSEVTGLGFPSDKQTLVWNSAAGAGAGTVHDVARGAESELPVGAGASETCLGSFAPATTADATLPADGQAFWYLVRGRNGCGTGTYGTRSNGAPRSTAVCP